jgi:hypothetical protein
VYSWYNCRDHNDVHPSAPPFNLSKDWKKKKKKKKKLKKQLSWFPHRRRSRSTLPLDSRRRRHCAAPGNVPFSYPNSGGYVTCYVGTLAYLRRILSEVMDDVRVGHYLGGGGSVGGRGRPAVAAAALASAPVRGWGGRVRGGVCVAAPLGATPAHHRRLHPPERPELVLAHRGVPKGLQLAFDNGLLQA